MRVFEKLPNEDLPEGYHEVKIERPLPRAYTMTVEELEKLTRSVLNPEPKER